MVIHKTFLNEIDNDLSSPFNLIIERITSAGCDIEFDRENREVFLNFTCSAGTLELTIAISECGKVIEFITGPRDFVPINRMYEVSEFCHRVNSELKFGRLELDFDTRHVRSRVCERFEKDNVNRILALGVATVSGISDAHYPALLDVLESRQSPCAAL